jgi:predicted TIM-barrel fold metal-dependent hydrolase
VICDCHVNIWNPEHVHPSFAQQLKRVRPGEVGLKADADTIATAMKGVDRAIIFTLRYGDSIGIEGEDSVTANAVRKYPGKFIGFSYVDPRRPDYMDLLAHSVKALGLRGVKYGPIYNRIPLSDRRMFAVYKYCVQNDLPLTLHMGTTYPRDCPIELGRPGAVEEIALLFPDLKVIMAHVGHPWFEECIVIARKQPNVYADVSALHYRPWQYYNILITAQEYRTADKLYFGTDFPFAGVEESIEGLTSINRLVQGTGLPAVSDETINGILHADPLANWWHDQVPIAPTLDAS